MLLLDLVGFSIVISFILTFTLTFERKLHVFFQQML